MCSIESRGMRIVIEFGDERMTVSGREREKRESEKRERKESTV